MRLLFAQNLHELDAKNLAYSSQRLDTGVCGLALLNLLISAHTQTGAPSKVSLSDLLALPNNLQSLNIQLYQYCSTHTNKAKYTKHKNQFKMNYSAFFT